MGKRGNVPAMGMPVLYTQSMTNAPELLSRLQEVGRCMALPFPSAAHEVRTACRALAHTTEAEGPEIAAAGQDLARAACRTPVPTCTCICAYRP